MPNALSQRLVREKGVDQTGAASWSLSATPNPRTISVPAAAAPTPQGPPADTGERNGLATTEDIPRPARYTNVASDGRTIILVREEWT